MFRSTFNAALAAGALLSMSVHADDLVISEYVEGSSKNKAIEIANTGATAVSLAAYSVAVYFNGSTSAGANIALGGTLAPDEVYVLAHSSAAAEVLAQADQTYGGGLFNGDDAVALLKSGVAVDVIGQIGFDPGSQWGSGDASTADNTLRRKPGLTGRTDGGSAFDPALEWDGFATNTFDGLGFFTSGADDTGGGIGFGQCGDDATPIHAIQGGGDSSPLNGEDAVIEAVVVGGFQDTTDGLRGFFVQSADAEQDGDPLTSEGLFVFDNGFMDVNAGERVRVQGTVKEYFGLTELADVVNVAVCANGVTATSATTALPVADFAELEAMEGMLVAFEHELTVSENYNLGRYGELVLSNGRLFQPTEIALPGADAQAVADANRLNRIVLDDGSRRQNPAVVPYPAPALSMNNTVRSGDTVTALVGVLDYAFDEYRVHPVQTPQFTASNPRSAAPSLSGERDLRVASFNVLNYFSGDGNGGGFPTARGADNVEEFERQRVKIVNAILAMDADIVGLMEIENDGYDDASAIADLVDALNAAGGDYAFVDPGVAQLGTDAIAVGMLYRRSAVRLSGAAATLSSYPFDTANRQPLAQTFRTRSGKKEITVVVNHFKSKGSCPNDGSAYDDQGDGQSCWNPLRVDAANALADWLDANPTGARTDKVLIIGDLNAYTMEDPLHAFADTGYINLQDGEIGYSYVFFGQAGHVDHALASPSLASHVSGVMTWHINADEPHALDYNVEFKTPQQVTDYYSAEPYRASDHDPVIIELDFDMTTQQRPMPKAVEICKANPPPWSNANRARLCNNRDPVMH